MTTLNFFLKKNSSVLSLFFMKKIKKKRGRKINASVDEAGKQ